MKTEEQKQRHRAASKKYRDTHAPKPLTEEQRLKRNAYAREYRKRPDRRAKSLEWSRKYRQENPEKVKAWFDKRPKDDKRRWWVLRGQSKYRGIECSITLEEYVELTKDGNCFYCKREIKETLGHRLDRKDNSKGYVVGNVVPCCFDCNRIKGEVLSYEEMCYIMPLLMDFRSAELAGAEFDIGPALAAESVFSGAHFA